MANYNNTVNQNVFLYVVQIFDFSLEGEEMKSITDLHRGWRYIVPTITVSTMGSLTLIVYLYNLPYLNCKVWTIVVQINSLQILSKVAFL